MIRVDYVPYIHDVIFKIYINISDNFISFQMGQLEIRRAVETFSFIYLFKKKTKNKGRRR